MEPTLRHGDLLVVLWRARPRVGTLVVVDLPPTADGSSRGLAVKRLTGTDPADPARWWVERDNPLAGVDSWLFGSLPSDAVRARVLFRIGSPLRRRPAAGVG